MFQIQEMTEVRLATFTKREETHGDEKVPAVSITVELVGANTLLDSIDPAIRHALYKAVDDQEQLPGVEPATPVLRCNSFEKHTLTASHEGWTLSVDDGLDETTPMVFGGCKVDKLVVEAQQGGSVILRFRIGTSDLDADRLGKLGMLHGRAMWITLKAPEPKPAAIDGSNGAFEADHPNAGDLFAAEHGDGSHGDGEGEGAGDGPADQDPLFTEAVAAVRDQQRASISFVQRHMRIGYNRAARLLEEMEKAGIVSAMDAEGKRDVLRAEAAA
jgi:Ftsk gamma domain